MVDSKLGDLLVGAMVTVFGFIGLILAAGALDVEIEIFGLGLVLFAVLFNFSLIKRYYDEKDAAHAKGGQGGH